MRILQFLYSKVFLKNLGIALLITAFIFFTAFKVLNVITLHGKTIPLPDYSEMLIEEIAELETSQYLEFLIIDSIYDASLRSGSVFMQDPLAFSNVKKGRKIYLTIIALSPEYVNMPDLRDLSVRRAVSLLRTRGLLIGKIEAVPSKFQNAVLEQFYNDDTIAPNTTIVKGSSIDLVIGKGKSKIPVPFLIGLKQADAILKINKSSLNIGKQKFYDEREPGHSRVYRQMPSCTTFTYLTPGASIDVWFRSDENFDFDALLEVYKTDEILTDTISEEIIEME